MEKSVFTNKMLRTEVEVRDIISGLPDSLLLHILSFLPAKEAVATSLLSKRWRPLWPSLPTLDLDRCDFQRLKFFHQFVDKMLKFVDLKSVKKFVLRLDYDKPREYFRAWEIHDWIIAVINNKVEHLELHLRSLDSDYELPSSIFSANNIKVLKLIGPMGVSRLWSGVTVGTLSHVNLPLLEILHLESVKFPDFRSLEMLLSACPLLKDLVLEDFRGNFKCPLDIGVLNHLVTADVPQYLLPLKVFSNVTFLHLLMSLQRKLSPLGPDIPTFHNLTYLGFDYYSHDWETTLKYLQSCPKLEILVIYEFDWSGRLEPTAEVPLCVSSNLKEFHLSNYRGKSGEFELARFIMKNAMVLRIISISKYPFSGPAWKSQSLKKISLCPISSVNCRLLLK